MRTADHFFRSRRCRPSVWRIGRRLALAPNPPDHGNQPEQQQIFHRVSQFAANHPPAVPPTKASRGSSRNGLPQPRGRERARPKHAIKFKCLPQKAVGSARESTTLPRFIRNRAAPRRDLGRLCPQASETGQSRWKGTKTIQQETSNQKQCINKKQNQWQKLNFTHESVAKSDTQLQYNCKLYAEGSPGAH